jgi:2,3-bisphosphoglycerate-independent phosphoglycerate mutase
VSPDHCTLLRTRAHAHGPVPFAMAGTGVNASETRAYDEMLSSPKCVAFDNGHELMHWFLG